MIEMHNHPEGIIFNILVQPRSSKNAIVGAHAGALKIKLTAAPVDNAANRMCIKFLAKCLGVSKSSLEIIAGHTARRKQVLWRAATATFSGDQHRRCKQQIESLLGS